MKAVILAGGFGTRLGEETDRIPKPMVQIGGKPILWHIMKSYSHYGINDFVICLGYKGYVVKEYFFHYRLHMSDMSIRLDNGELEIHQNTSEPWKVTLVNTGLSSQTGGRLRRVRDYIGDETFCFTYGDGLSDVAIDQLIAFHKSHGKLATVTVVSPPGRFGVLELEGDRAVGFVEKPPQVDAMINGGFFVLEPAAIDAVESDGTIWEQEPMAHLVKSGQLMAYRHDGFWQAMDTLREKHKLELLWQAGSAPWRIWGDE